MKNCSVAVLASDVYGSIRSRVVVFDAQHQQNLVVVEHLANMWRTADGQSVSRVWSFTVIRRAWHQQRLTGKQHLTASAYGNNGYDALGFNGLSFIKLSNSICYAFIVR
ncbi:MAG: hypothetical protein LUQ11_14230 [Methylococcaceae bacterium]|nr:hypothetical protein [Methylococcaceae bacterium]